MHEFLVKMPKSKVIELIGKIINKIEIGQLNPIYRIKIDNAFKYDLEIIGNVDGDTFWMQEVLPGRATSLMAFYGVITEEGEDTKIVGDFKIIPETRIIFGWISLKYSFFAACAYYIFKTSFWGFLAVLFFPQFILLLILLVAIRTAKKDKIIKILSNLDNPAVLWPLIKR